jgi:hypothetical protein
MGKQLSFEIPPNSDGVDKLMSKTKEMAALLESRPGIDEVNVRVSETLGGPSNVDLLLWGHGVNARAIAQEMQESFPELAQASVEITDLKGEIKENLGSKIGRVVLNLDMGDATEEELRVQILEQLAAQGFQGDADVKVSRDGDFTTIGVELSTDDGENATEDVIEIMTDGDPETIEIDTGASTEGDGGGDGEKQVQLEKVKKER